ncbi:MAG TPA: 3-oxoadipate enol-lactonase [Casimicrobiaceae bacterium]|nr:3-oxoadipate enol-lactonase [Casimicrobiaceae bacterium]
MPHADFAHARINYRVDGPPSAPWLTLSNSLGTDLDMWAPQVPALIERFRVLRYDTRGHGASSAPAAPYSIPALADDVVALLDHVGAERTHFCGLSMGGMIGIRLALAAPRRIDRMVLANTGAKIGSAEGWNARISAVHTTGLATIADGIMERWFVRAFREAHPHEIARMRDVLVKASPDGYAACCAAIRDYDARPELAAIRAPTLAIAGAHDGPTPSSDLRFIAEHVPGARYVELDAAHLSNIEQPTDFVAALVGHFTA